jgi:hypothetical protein
MKNRFHHPKKDKSMLSTWTYVVGVFFLGILLLVLFVAKFDMNVSQKAKLPDFEQYAKVAIKSISYLQRTGEQQITTGDSTSKIPNLRHQDGNTISSNSVISQTSSNRKHQKRDAYAITITKDGSFQDGAAVLAYSIMKYSWNRTYDISFIAFVHPNVTASRPILKRLGYHVIEVPIPINTSAIQFSFLREKINKNGCCGSAEMIKLTSYRLLQYDRVIHLDADVILLNVSE